MGIKARRFEDRSTQEPTQGTATDSVSTARDGAITWAQSTEQSHIIYTYLLLPRREARVGALLTRSLTFL
jgi:hypothetical protein